MQSFSHEIDWLKSRISQDPASMFYARLADRFLKNNDVDEAIEVAEKATLLHPHDATARFVLAKCYYVKQDYEKADKNLTNTLALDPNHLAALDLQADLFGHMGQGDRAQDSIDMLIDLDPLNEAVHLKNIAVPKVRHSAKETFEDEWNAALLPEDERPAPRFESDLPEVQDFDDQLDTAVEEELDSSWETSEFDEPFTFDQPDKPVGRESVPDDSFEDDPFADFEETEPFEDAASFQKTRYDVDETEAVVEDAPPAFDEPDVQRHIHDEFGSEEVLDESIEDDFEIDKSKFREEKSRFTRLLDDIFSSNLDEEEQRELHERTALERIADSEPQAEEPEDYPKRAATSEDYEPLLPPDEIIFPEEKILESDRSHHEKSFDFDDESDLDDEQELLQNFDTEWEKAAQQRDETPDRRSEDFSKFLDSLDIQDSPTVDKDFPVEFDDPLPRFDDDLGLSDELNDLLEPLSEEDDWMQELSDAASEGSMMDDLDSESDMDDKNEAPSVDKKSGKSDKGKFYTPTLGEIYAAQGQYAKAISVYENLLKSDPDNDLYQSKLVQLRKKLAEQQ